MDFHELPTEVKNDVEDQSLGLLEIIRDDVLVIGGWAVRALVGESHLRFTWDIDGVLAEEDMEIVRSKMISASLEPAAQEWGIQFRRSYAPRVDIRDDEVRETVERLELRVELSPPRMRERDTQHFFEFDLSEFLIREVRYHEREDAVPIRVPPAHVMAANKLGLPADLKNNFDVAVLLMYSEIERVVESIDESDAWREMVLRRMRKRKTRLMDSTSWEGILMRDAGINAKELAERLGLIERALSRKHGGSVILNPRVEPSMLLPYSFTK